MRNKGLTWEMYTVTVIVVIALLLGCGVTCLLGAPVYFLWFLDKVW